MNLVSHHGARTVIRQVPFMLLFVAAVFSLPFLAVSLSLFVAGKDAGDRYFCLFFGLLMLWLSLEYAATRESIEIDLANQILKRTVHGVFRHRQQVVDLRTITGISLDQRMLVVGAGTSRRYQFLSLDGPQETFPMNTPQKIYLDHRKLGRRLRDATQLPYRELRDGKVVEETPARH